MNIFVAWGSGTNQGIGAYSVGGSSISANFYADVLSGYETLLVNFTDISIGSPTSWVWDFGDGTSSTDQNPSHLFSAGTYTITLTVSNETDSDTETKTEYITVFSPCSASFVVYPQLQFVGNNITFSADVYVPPIVSATLSAYSVMFGDGQIGSVLSTNVLTHQYSRQGIYTSFHNYKITSGTSVILNAKSSISNIKINNKPKIDFIGIPNVSSTIDFYDVQGGYYIPNTVVSADWDFGDGNVSSTTDLISPLEHVYNSVGNYNVSVSAYDISGNVGVSSIIFSVLEGRTCEAKKDYISICGPETLGRFGSCRKINLVEYLPLYLRGSETEQFLVFFEDFLNNMYDGSCGWQVSSNYLPVSQQWSVVNSGSPDAYAKQEFFYEVSGVSALTEATNVEQLNLSWPSNVSYSTSAQKISILEKIARLTELHDPSLIDIEYIQFFAANLGYNVNVSRDEVGISGTTENFGTTEIEGECSAADINRYLRFVVENLPTWYKIKTTRNSIKVMLYSFGLVADLIEYFTNNYQPTSAGGSWRADFRKDLADIPNNWFPTPHFAIYVDFDLSSDISFEVQRRQKVIRAIESIRPINTVFRKLVGYVKRVFDLKAACYIRSTRYTVIESNGYSNGWGL